MVEEHQRVGGPEHLAAAPEAVARGILGQVDDPAGLEVWRWSTGRMFTQALRTRPVDGGETVSFAEPLRGGVPSGTYTVVAQLRSDNHPIEVRRAIVLP